MNDKIGRTLILQNNNWKFMHGDYTEGKQCDFDDSGWYDIGVPHSFGIPYFLENEFYIGYGCYRKKMQIEKNWIGKHVTLEFQGVFQETEIYINGIQAGIHAGGYTAFEVNISDFIKEGENCLFIRVNNLWNPKLAPRAGEHQFNGGIYRDVSLIVTEPVYITWYGTSITTPEVSKEKASIAVKTEVKNEFSNDIDCRLVSVIEFKEQEVTRIQSVCSLKPGEVFEFEQSSQINYPQLWHPDTPNLYQLKSFVCVGVDILDSFQTSFGIRRFEFTPDKGFFLNGEHYAINGANVHQDHAGWADAVTHSGIKRDITMIKECGMNFIRGSHYPHHTYFAEECDRQGILFWSENCFWGTGGPNEDGYWTASAYPVREEEEAEFEESCERSLAEMIRTNRNHPSIIVWSMCNEPFFSDELVMDKAKSFITKLVKLTHQLDGTRPAAVGGAQRGNFDVLGDLAGYNGDGAKLYMDPGFPNFVSEYGSTVSDRPGEYTPSYTDGVETDYSWRSGKAIWCGFHHGSILFDMGHMGMIDYYRVPLNSWHWYREKFLGIGRPAEICSGVPYALKLSADNTVITCDGVTDAHIIVTVVDKYGRRIANTMEVTLKVEQGGAIFPTGKTFVLTPGKNFIEGTGAIELRSYYAGESNITAKAAGLISAELIIETKGDEPWTGQELNGLQPPPFVKGPPVSDKNFNIALHRPVFYSSSHKEHSGKNITDGDKESYWYPETDKPGEWIMVDLEGSKEVKSASVVFTESNNKNYEVGVSDDGRRFRTVFTSKPEELMRSAEFNLAFSRVRYLRIRFTDAPAGIRRIEILA